MCRVLNWAQCVQRSAPKSMYYFFGLFICNFLFNHFCSNSWPFLEPLIHTGLKSVDYPSWWFLFHFLFHFLFTNSFYLLILKIIIYFSNIFQKWMIFAWIIFLSKIVLFKEIYLKKCEKREREQARASKQERDLFKGEHGESIGSVMWTNLLIVILFHLCSMMFLPVDSSLLERTIVIFDSFISLLCQQYGYAYFVCFLSQTELKYTFL